MNRSLKVASLLAFTSIIKGNISVILLTILILALVSLNLLFVTGLLAGLISGANDKLIDTYTSNIVIESDTDNPLIRNVDQLVTRIEAIDGVIAAVPRNSLSAQLSFDEKRANCIVYGVRPDEERKVFHIYQSLIEGRYLEPNDRDEILLGIELAGADNPDIELYARSLQKVHAGDKVSATFANGVQKRYTVKGIFYSEFIQTDLQAFVSEEEFMSLNALARDRATSIHVKIAENADASSVIQQIGSIRDGLKVLSWEDYAGIVQSMTGSFNVINTILNGVNLLVAGIAVFIVTYIDVANRRRQIGIQRAIGITPSSITGAYLIRAIFYALVGIILAGLVFVYIVIPVEARYPFHFPFGDVYLHTGLTFFLRAGSILLGASIIAAFIPVRGVMRMKILDAIWG